MRIHLFGSADDPKISGEHLEAVASHAVGIGDGLKMLSAQAANEVLRHCRIGRIWQKS